MTKAAGITKVILTFLKCTL